MRISAFIENEEVIKRFSNISVCLPVLSHADRCDVKVRPPPKINSILSILCLTPTHIPKRPDHLLAAYYLLP